ncbi:ankyrin repeat domain-containing protein [Microbacterium halotolerans]|uniref:ankyrin repeat domain-containing protein n=1 Tax=Microbacterium halotolerans TaxID=246613 RepID=UPI000E6ABCAD|nr:ankyrin repeat domain-containing protein [Microbacterium halotolerans]
MTEELPDEVVEFGNRMFDLAREGDAQLLAYIDQGVDADLTNSLGDTLLMLAAYNGRTELVAGLIERDADVNALNDRGQAPVAGAVFKGYDDIVGLLIEAGADLDAGTPSARDTASMFGRTLPGT